MIVCHGRGATSTTPYPSDSCLAPYRDKRGRSTAPSLGVFRPPRSHHHPGHTRFDRLEATTSPPLPSGPCPPTPRSHPRSSSKPRPPSEGEQAGEHIPRTPRGGGRRPGALPRCRCLGTPSALPCLPPHNCFELLTGRLDCTVYVLVLAFVRARPSGDGSVWRLSGLVPPFFLYQC